MFKTMNDFLIDAPEFVVVPVLFLVVYFLIAFPVILKFKKGKESNMTKNKSTAAVGDDVGITISDKSIEQQIQNKNLNAPRITQDDIDNAIDGVDYHVFKGTQLTVCCITLKNGFNVTGESACASPENFDEEIGRSIAYANAKEKVWSLEGYLLKQQLFLNKLIDEAVTISCDA